MEIFNEIYSTYYQAIEKLIALAMDDCLDREKAIQVIESCAFSESSIHIMDKVHSEQWQVITKDYKTPIRHKATKPMSHLEKRFLKTISQDPRFKLFIDEDFGEFDFSDLDVEPLFDQKDIYFFDQFSDGDHYEDALYILNFRTILKAIQEEKQLNIVFESSKENLIDEDYSPRRIQYSQKDDKFRLICLGRKSFYTINISRIKSCTIIDQAIVDYQNDFLDPNKVVILEIIDERNALERSLYHFSNFEKTTIALSDNKYEMTIKYHSDDETELVIRVLAFGPMVRVLAPQPFIEQIKERIYRQKKLRKT